MLQFTKKAKELKILRANKKPEKYNDIIVIKPTESVEKDKDNNIVIKRRKEKINLSRKINETAKLLKNENAQNNLEKIKQIFKA